MSSLNHEHSSIRPHTMHFLQFLRNILFDVGCFAERRGGKNEGTIMFLPKRLIGFSPLFRHYSIVTPIFKCIILVLSILVMNYYGEREMNDEDIET